MKDELEQVNQAVMRGAGSSDSSGDDACLDDGLLY